MSKKVTDKVTERRICRRLHNLPIEYTPSQLPPSRTRSNSTPLTDTATPDSSDTESLVPSNNTSTPTNNPVTQQLVPTSGPRTPQQSTSSGFVSPGRSPNARRAQLVADNLVPNLDIEDDSQTDSRPLSVVGIANTLSRFRAGAVKVFKKLSPPKKLFWNYWISSRRT